MDRPVRVAATPDKDAVLPAAARHMSSNGGSGSPDDGGRKFAFHYYSEDRLLDWVVTRDFGCFSPGSAFSVVELERRWQEWPWSRGVTPDITTSPFATSPVVFVLSPEAAVATGASERVLSWSDLLDPARPLRVMHPHARSGDGLAVVTAAYEAAGGDPSTPSLDVAHSAPDRLMAGMQRRVVEYGPDDATVIDRAVAGGRWQADVVLVQERSALAALTRHPSMRAVLVHPVEGSTWVDQEVDCIEPTATAREREAVEGLVRALRRPEMAAGLREQGWRPLGEEVGTAADTEMLLQAQPTSVGQRVQVIGVATPPGQQMPRRLVRVLRNRWSESKKAAEVCLVIDVSGSMSGTKLAAAQRAAEDFLDRLEGADSSFALVTFADSVHVLAPMQPLHAGKADAVERLRRIRGNGMTALLDGVDRGLTLLQDVDPGHLKALILLTDGEENRSSTTVVGLENRLSRSGCLLFAVGYGEGADMGLLERLAGCTGGRASISDERQVGEVYAALSAHL